MIYYFAIPCEKTPTYDKKICHKAAEMLGAELPGRNHLRRSTIVNDKQRGIPCVLLEVEARDGVSKELETRLRLLDIALIEPNREKKARKILYGVRRPWTHDLDFFYKNGKAVDCW